MSLEDCGTYHAEGEERPSPFYSMLWRYPVIFVVGAIQAVGTVASECFGLVFHSYGQVHIGGRNIVTFSGYYKMIGSMIAVVGCGLIGMLSDVKGRRFAVVLQSTAKTLSSILFFIMGESNQSFWIAYWMSCVLGGLVGSAGGPGPGVFSYLFSNIVTDATPPVDRPQAQATCLIVRAVLMIPLQWTLRNFVFTYHSDTLIQIIGLCSSAIFLTMLVFLLPNTAKQHVDRSHYRCKTINPLGPMRVACTNKRIAMLCAITAFVGVADALEFSPTTSVYINQELGISNDRDAQEQLQSTRAVIRTVAGPIGILVVPVLTRFFTRIHCVYVSLVLGGLYVLSAALIHFYQNLITVYIMSCFGTFLILPNILLISLVSEFATTPEQVGTCLGARESVKALLDIFIGPIESHTYNHLQQRGLAWVTYAIFGFIMLCGTIPLTVLKISLSNQKPLQSMPRIRTIDATTYTELAPGSTALQQSG